MIGVTFGVRKGSAALYLAGFALAATWLIAFALVPSRVRPHRRLVADITMGLGAGVTMFGVFLAGAWVLTTVPSGNAALVIAAVGRGAVFTILRIRTGALTASIATHLSWSALMIALVPR